MRNLVLVASALAHGPCPSTGLLLASMLQGTCQKPGNHPDFKETLSERKGPLGTVSEPPTCTICLTCTSTHLQFVPQYTPPICIAVPSWLPKPSRLKQGKSHCTPPICTGSTFEKVPGVGSSGKFLTGEFWAILGAALGILKVILRMRNLGWHLVT